MEETYGEADIVQVLVEEQAVHEGQRFQQTELV
jgi:hypothetical protein